MRQSLVTGHANRKRHVDGPVHLRGDGTADTLNPADIAPGLRRVTAPNPSPMTAAGTNTYIVGTGRVAVIDPGPAIPSHLDAILAALGPDETVSHILVTHSHLDHSTLARALSARTGAPVCGFGDSLSGRSQRMADLAATGLPPAEGVDLEFRPDIRLADGDVLTNRSGGWQLTALHTPGHFGNHLSFLWDDAVFSGDLAMGWSTSLIAPPDGDMAAYMASLDRLVRQASGPLWPGHGDPVPDGPQRLADLSAHRRGREAQVLAALAGRDASPAEIARSVYVGTDPRLMPAATLNVLAHLLDLLDRNRVMTGDFPNLDARFRLA